MVRLAVRILRDALIKGNRLRDVLIRPFVGANARKRKKAEGSISVRAVMGEGFKRMDGFIRFTAID